VVSGCFGALVVFGYCGMHLKQFTGLDESQAKLIMANVESASDKSSTMSVRSNLSSLNTSPVLPIMVDSVSPRRTIQPGFSLNQSSVSSSSSSHLIVTHDEQDSASATDPDVSSAVAAASTVSDSQVPRMSRLMTLDTVVAPTAFESSDQRPPLLKSQSSSESLPVSIPTRSRSKSSTWISSSSTSPSTSVSSPSNNSSNAPPSLGKLRNRSIQHIEAATSSWDKVSFVHLAHFESSS
jgi:hypothetical protein